jgi:predicted kinase
MTRLENHVGKTEVCAMRSRMVDGFINSYKSAPEEIVLDIDGWDDPTHGNQQLSCFHGYYGQPMYFPVLINEVSKPKVLQFSSVLPIFDCCPKQLTFPSIFMPTSSIGYILIGLPGSGKTTLAHQIFQRSPYHQIVSTDQIRECLYGSPSIQGHWPTIERHILTQIQQALQAQKTVIYDATNYNHHHRIDLLQKLSKLSSIQWIGLYLNTPLDQCKLQNRQRDRQVPEDIIEIMDECLRAFPPTLAEGFAKIYQIPGGTAGKIEQIEN